MSLDERFICILFISKSLLSAGDANAAQQYLQEALEKYSSQIDNVKSNLRIETLEHHAEVKVAVGTPMTACELIQLSLQKFASPSHESRRSLLLSLVAQYIRANLFELAMESSEKLIDEFPDSPSLLQHCRVLLQCAQIQRAQDVLDENAQLFDASEETATDANILRYVSAFF